MDSGNKGTVFIAIDKNGKKLVVLPQILFKGKRSISWDEVEEYLIRYVGEIIKIAETGDLIHIEKDFADEFSSSVYTRKLKAIW